MAFRGPLTSSIFSSSSLGNNRSQSNSRSSLLGGISKPWGVLTHAKSERKQQQSKTKRTPHSLESSQEDLHSYLSSFNGSKSAAIPGTKKRQKNIDWEKLVEASDAAQSLGFEYEVNEYGGFEELSSDDEQKGTNFLKAAQSTKTRHNEGVQKQRNHSHKQVSASQRNPSLHGSVGNKLCDLKYVRGSTDFVNTFGGEDESIGISDSTSYSQLRSTKQKSTSTLSTSEADDTNTNPLAHVKVASELTLSDNTDTDGHQLPLPVRQPTKESASGHSESDLESELSKEDTDLEDLSTSEPLNLHKNVFSIDELNGITPEEEDESISNDTPSQSVNTDSDCSPNIKNVFSIDDLEMRGSVSTKVESSQQKHAHNGNGKNTSGLVIKNDRQVSSSHQTGKSFKFSATSKVEPVRKNEATDSTVASDTEQSIKDVDSVISEQDQSERLGYSDDEDFESETLSEHGSNEEEITLAGILSERDDTLSQHKTNATDTDHDRSKQSISDDGLYLSGAHDQQEKTELTESRQQQHEAMKPPHKLSSKKTPHTCTCSGNQNPEGQEPYVNVDSYIWPRVIVGAHYGKEYLDPSPILPHVISADALEVLTAYSPSTVALTDMLRAQLHLTRQLVANNRQLVANLSSNISANYHYTTLEETKQYIAKHRPKVITTAEAMQQVEDEFVS